MLKLVGKYEGGSAERSKRQVRARRRRKWGRALIRLALRGAMLYSGVCLGRQPAGSIRTATGFGFRQGDARECQRLVKSYSSVTCRERYWKPQLQSSSHDACSECGRDRFVEAELRGIIQFRRFRDCTQPPVVPAHWCVPRSSLSPMSTSKRFRAGWGDSRQDLTAMRESAAEDRESRHARTDSPRQRKRGYLSAASLE